MNNHFLIKLKGDQEKQTEKIALTLYSKFDGENTLVKVFAVFEILNSEYFGKRLKKNTKKFK